MSACSNPDCLAAAEQLDRVMEHWKESLDARERVIVKAEEQARQFKALQAEVLTLRTRVQELQRERDGDRLMKFEGGFLQWPGGGMNLDMLQVLLAPAGLRVVAAADLASGPRSGHTDPEG